MVSIDLYDTLENKHYASFTGHATCDPAALAAIGADLKRCQLDSGNIWLDGDDQHDPDLDFKFNGLIHGKSTQFGDESTKRQFLNGLKTFLND